MEIEEKLEFLKENHALLSVHDPERGSKHYITSNRTGKYYFLSILGRLLRILPSIPCDDSKQKFCETQIKRSRIELGENFGGASNALQDSNFAKIEGLKIINDVVKHEENINKYL